MADQIIKFMGFEPVDRIESVHNYIDFQRGMIRKGAISAGVKEDVLIPLNMWDGTLLGVGKGNPDWNYSAPHGAGRLMSRTKAKATLSLEEFGATMDEAGVWTSCVKQSTLDEAPMAYKNADEIKAYVDDTIELTAHLRPVYNFKA